MFLKNSQKISSKVVSLVFGVLILCFALGFWALAWEEPSQAPPGDNVPAPLNVGTDAQTKSGYLTFPTFYDFQNTDYYVDPAGGAGDISAILSGKVGIGTINPGYKLDVSGDANATRLCITGDCRNVWPSGGGISCSDCDAMFQDDIGADCGSGKYTYGVLEDGTLKCRTDQTGGGGITCPDCDGRFVNEGDEISCPDCDGRFVNVTGDTMTGTLEAKQVKIWDQIDGVYYPALISECEVYEAHSSLQGFSDGEWQLLATTMCGAGWRPVSCNAQLEDWWGNPKFMNPADGDKVYCKISSLVNNTAGLYGTEVGCGLIDKCDVGGIIYTLCCKYNTWD